MDWVYPSRALCHFFIASWARVTQMSCKYVAYNIHLMDYGLQRITFPGGIKTGTRSRPQSAQSKGLLIYEHITQHLSFSIVG